MITSITSVLAPLAGSTFAGFFIGFFLRKIIKWIFIIVGSITGAFFFGMLLLQQYGYIKPDSILWDKIGNDISVTIQQWIGNITTSNGGEVYNIIHNLGIPISAGLTMGIIIGFSRGG
jgi:uncharacterized membrane protein (Fun14 family)